MTEIEQIQQQLDNPKFTTNAPAEAVERLKDKLLKLQRDIKPVISCPNCGRQMPEWMGSYWCENYPITKDPKCNEIYHLTN